MNDYTKLWKRARYIQHKMAHLAVNLLEAGTSITQKQLDKVIDKMTALAELPLEQPSDEAYEECLTVYAKVYERYEQALKPMELEYLQGKKDGMRTILSMLAPTARQVKAWKVLQETSDKGL